MKLLRTRTKLPSATRRGACTSSPSGRVKSPRMLSSSKCSTVRLEVWPGSAPRSLACPPRAGLACRVSAGPGTPEAVETSWPRAPAETSAASIDPRTATALKILPSFAIARFPLPAPWPARPPGCPAAATCLLVLAPRLLHDRCLPMTLERLVAALDEKVHGVPCGRRRGRKLEKLFRFGERGLRILLGIEVQPRELQVGLRRMRRQARSEVQVVEGAGGPAQAREQRPQTQVRRCISRGQVGCRGEPSERVALEASPMQRLSEELRRSRRARVGRGGCLERGELARGLVVLARHRSEDEVRARVARGRLCGAQREEGRRARDPRRELRPGESAQGGDALRRVRQDGARGPLRRAVIAQRQLYLGPKLERPEGPGKRVLGALA